MDFEWFVYLRRFVLVQDMSAPGGEVGLLGLIGNQGFSAYISNQEKFKI
ncbi:hypothetical protein NIES3585_46400 [Nodularia sp. NIES-3585]|nr:hypothetical protein NIES3585_46400 [Nodularia sp. NIES-3585]